MANLGTPSHTQVNQGEQRINTQADAQALAAGLNVAGKVIDYAVDKKASEATEEAISEGIKEATIRPEPVALAVDHEQLASEGFTPTQIAEIESLSKEIQYAQAQLTQATSTRIKNLALLHVQRAQQTLKGKFGIAGDRIDAMAARVTQNSPELTEALINAESKQGSIEAAGTYLDRIAKQGYDELGINAQYPVGSPEFMQEYVARQTWKQKRERDEQYYAMRLADGTLTDLDRLGHTKRGLRGRQSTIDEKVTQPIVDELGKLDQLRRDPNTTPTQVAQAYEAFVPWSNSMLRRITNQKVEVERGFLTVWGDAMDTESKSYKMAVQIKDSLIQDLDMQAEMLQQGNLAIVDYLRQQQTMAGHEMLDKLPTLRTIASINAVAPELFQTMDSLDYVNAVPLLSTEVLQDLGKEVRTSGLFGADVVGAEGHESPESRAMEREKRDSADPYSGTVTMNEDPDKQAAASFVPLTSYIHTAATTPTAIDPEPAFDMFLTGVAGGIQRVHRNVTTHPENLDVGSQVSEITSFLAGDTFWNRIKEFDRTSPSARDFKYQLENSYLRSAATTPGGGVRGLMPHIDMRNDILERAQRDRYGQPLSAFFEVDIAATEAADKFVFVVDETAAKAAIRKQVEQIQQMTRQYADRAFFVTEDIDARVNDKFAILKADVARLATDATTYGRLIALAETPDDGVLKLGNAFLFDAGEEASFADMFMRK